MLRLPSIRNVLAVITMTVAALCGGGKAFVAQKGSLSVVEVQRGGATQSDTRKRETSITPAGSEAVIVSGNVTANKEGIFDTSFVSRAEATFSVQNKSTSRPIGAATDQFRKFGAFVRPRTRAPPNKISKIG